MPRIVLALVATSLFCMSWAAGAADPDPAAGRRLFERECMSCHGESAAGRPRVAPALDGVVGRRAGTVPDYLYSTRLSRSTVVWSEASLDAYLAHPRSHVPNDASTVRMWATEQDRAQVIAYLKSISPPPVLVPPAEPPVAVPAPLPAAAPAVVAPRPAQVAPAKKPAGKAKGKAKAKKKAPAAPKKPDAATGGAT